MIGLPTMDAAPPKPKVSRARTMTRTARWKAKVAEGQPRHNWIVQYGTLRITYSSHAAAMDAALLLRMWGLITPYGLVGMQREQGEA